jgi:hypothetical protein
MLTKKYIHFFIYVSLITFLLTGIGGCKCKKERPEVSNIQLTIKADRFEKDFFSMQSNDETNKVSFLKNKYGNFFNLYVYQITALGSPDSVLMAQHINDFISDTNFRKIYDDCEKIFGNFDEQNAALTEAFKLYSYYFNGKNIPRVITFISGFSYPIVCDSLNLGISIDMYMGPTYKFYSTIEPAFPIYLRNRMHKDYIVCDAMKGWAESDYGIDESSARMIDFMIGQGRLLFFLDKITPDAPDTIKSGYSSTQMNWCRSNEKKIWSFFIDNKLLFSFDPNLMNKYVNDGPTTNGFPKESPGNIGKYIGWQIVKSYMDNHKEVSLQQLMEQKDLLKIFNESKYKPR